LINVKNSGFKPEGVDRLAAFYLKSGNFVLPTRLPFISRTHVSFKKIFIAFTLLFNGGRKPLPKSIEKSKNMGNAFLPTVSGVYLIPRGHKNRAPLPGYKLNQLLKHKQMELYGKCTGLVNI